MTESVYPIAKVAVSRIHRHFESHLASAIPHAGRHLAPLPDPETLGALINAGFWASLQKEEGYSPRTSLAFVEPRQVHHPLLFERPFPLAAKMLTKVAPAVERPGIHLGVCRDGDSLTVWGATTNLPLYCFVLEVVAPGLLVVKDNGGADTDKFVNVAVLQGDQVKIIDQRASRVPGCPGLLKSLLSLEPQSMLAAHLRVLVQLAVSMRAHGRGGSLLVVPSGAQAWRESILSPVSYSVLPPFSALADLAGEDFGGSAKYALHRVIEAVAGLTAVDGATVISDKYELLAFGAKITRPPGAPWVDRLILTEPVEGVEATVVEPARLGGTRHLSAAQFAKDQKDAISLVASQDGRFTVFGWSKVEDTLRAHRIETLLL